MRTVLSILVCAAIASCQPAGRQGGAQAESSLQDAEKGRDTSASSIVAKRFDDRVDFLRGETLVASYRFKGVSRPVVWPLHVPGGHELTRRWPMAKARKGEAKDHPHHRSLWFAHGNVNGHDFWSEAPRAGKIVQVELHEGAVAETKSTEGMPAAASFITTRNEWRAKDGTRICSDRRVIRVHERGVLRFLDIDVQLIASDGKIVLGDTKEGTMAVRVRPTLRNTGKVALGKYLSSAGLRDKQLWGKRARWIHVQGPIANDEGAAVIGVGIFDHPQNPRFPTWWHARPYGLLAANPFGIHDFTKRSKDPKPRGAGDLTIEATKSVTFRYRFLLHQGPMLKDTLDAEFNAWSAEKPSFKFTDK